MKYIRPLNREIQGWELTLLLPSEYWHVFKATYGLGYNLDNLEVINHLIITICRQNGQPMN